MVNRQLPSSRSHLNLPDVHHIPEAPYLPTPSADVVASTPLARAGWYEEGQHGGVVSALLARCVEAVPTLAPMEVARLTVELFRVVPITTLRTAARVIREGKRIQVVEASLFDDDDLELARAAALRLRTTRLDLPGTARPSHPPVPAPDELPVPDMGHWGLGDSGRVLYHRHAIEVREVGEGFRREGPGAMWLRIHRPLVAGEEITPLTRAVVTGDFVNGLSRLIDARRFVFMNADLTIHLSRMPRGEWVGLSAESLYDPGGRGVATGVLFDRESAIGRSTQSLFLEEIR